jgi:ankyrin repeat protein
MMSHQYVGNPSAVSRQPRKMLKTDRSIFVVKTDDPFSCSFRCENGSIHFQDSETYFRPASQRRIATPPLPPPLQYDYKVSIPLTNERMNRILDRELIVAAKENNLPEVSRLLSVGADVNAADISGYAPLHWACKNGHMEVVIELLNHGADIEANDNIEWTPLHCACYNDHLPVVKALLSGGANILAVTIHGKLPIHLAVSWRKSEVCKYLLQRYYATTRRLPLHELVEDLTWIGNPYSSDAPPILAALNRNVLGKEDVIEILEYLVGRNPELLSSRDQDGSLPLHVACRRGASFTIVQSLVNLYKASVKSLTPQGHLPLFLACEMPETSLDTIFILMKLYPDLVYR